MPDFEEVQTKHIAWVLALLIVVMFVVAGSKVAIEYGYAMGKVECLEATFTQPVDDK